MYLPPTVNNFDGRVRASQISSILMDANIIAKISSDKNSILKLDRETHLLSLASDELSEWRKLREECDQKAYSVAALDAVGDKISATIAPVIRPIVKGVQTILPSGGKEVPKVLGRGGQIIERAATTIDRRVKIASLSTPKMPQDILIDMIESEILSQAALEGIYCSSLNELSEICHSISKRASAAEAGVVKAVGKSSSHGLATTIPILGLIADLTLMGKNLYEAWVNGKKIIEELPLQKWGISLSSAILPTPSNTRFIGKQLESLSKQHKDSPEDLREILKIAQTLKGYGTDFVSTITNLILSILDVAELVWGLGTLISFLLSIPVMATEMANDHIVEEAYDKSIELIKNTCDENIARLEGSQNEISSDDKEFMRKMLGNIGSSEEKEGEAISDSLPKAASNRLQRIKELSLFSA